MPYRLSITSKNDMGDDMGDDMDTTGKARSADPLRTLEVLVGVIVTLMTVVVGAVLLGAVAGTGSIPGVDAEVCVTTLADGTPAFRQVEGEATGPVGLSEGITWRADQVQVCDPDPDGVTRALGVAGLTMWTIAPLLFFGLLWRLLRRARREGVFADQVPGGLRMLGRLLLLWAALDLVVTGFVNAALLNRMTDDGLVLFSSYDVPWLLVLLGVALLALERVMAQAVLLRHEAEATI